MSTGADKEAQFAHMSSDPSGGNMSGGAGGGGDKGFTAKQPVRLTVVSFMGKSGQPDNQNTSRDKGST